MMNRREGNGGSKICSAVRETSVLFRSFSITSGTRFFVNNDDEFVGFSRAGSDGIDLIDGPGNSAFATWTMLTSIGPFTGPGSIEQ
jgi:hypothetical protein